MKKIFILAIILKIIIMVFMSFSAGLYAAEVTIEMLPVDDVIYKIADDLNFENWNFGFTIKNLQSVTAIDRLQIRHYSGPDQINMIEYNGKTLAQFLKKKDGFLFHNFHIMLPAGSEADRLSLEIFSKQASLARRSVKLVRYRQQNHYRLPVKGTWFLSSGHDFGIEHRRHMSRGHFAWDLVRINKNGKASNGPNLVNNFAFGQPLLAPASGVVVAVYDGEKDNKPGAANLSRKANYIEIDHGKGEISRVVHLKKGSIKVAVGDRVVSGQIIAEIGNSGNSERAHLHIGFQRNIVDAKGNIKQVPIPILFSNYSVSWNQGIDLPMKKGRPRRGQFIRAL